ncbi:hypothetical protein JG687_00016517, partial [Phytophthora cactorum]
DESRLCRFDFTLRRTDSTWKKKFRFKKDDLVAHVAHFRFPDPFPTKQRYHISVFEALCIFLRRMAYPARLSDLQDLFGRDETTISTISNDVLEILYATFKHLLQSTTTV